MIARGTKLEGAELKMKIDPGNVNCDCGYNGIIDVGDVDGHDPDPAQPCPQCEKLIRVGGGRGVANIEIELVETNASTS